MPRQWSLVVIVALAVGLAACENWNPQKQREEELARNTFSCIYNGERFVVRFAEGEARVLLAGQRINLYQIPVGSTGSLVRYSNGSMELRGRGTELTFIIDSVPTVLQNCEPYATLPTPGK